MMVTSAAGRHFITVQEGNKLKAYQDSVGVWTIGVGHTSMAGPPPVVEGMTISPAESDAILAHDLQKVEHSVLSAVTVPMEQHEFDALVSLCFNIGPGNFSGSTVVKELNADDRASAGNAFLM